MFFLIDLFHPEFIQFVSHGWWDHLSVIGLASYVFKVD